MVNTKTVGDDELLTPDETAEWLKVPVRTLSQWRYQREGPAWFKVGRHVRYQRSDVARWLEGKRDTGTAA